MIFSTQFSGLGHGSALHGRHGGVGGVVQDQPAEQPRHLGRLGVRRPVVDRDRVLGLDHVHLDAGHLGPTRRGAPATAGPG